MQSQATAAPLLRPTCRWVRCSVVMRLGITRPSPMDEVRGLTVLSADTSKCARLDIQLGTSRCTLRRSRSTNGPHGPMPRGTKKRRQCPADRSGARETRCPRKRTSVKTRWKLRRLWLSHHGHDGAEGHPDDGQAPVELESRKYSHG